LKETAIGHIFLVIRLNKVNLDIIFGPKTGCFLQEAKELGLEDYEYSFYSAVSDNQSARELMKKDKPRELAVVLYQTVKEKATIDWTTKESVQASLRVAIR
jgi:type I site-specific restriction-modification system R (restriction) subunit